MMERIWKRRQLQQKLGARIVRYADDIVILCRWGTKRPMAVLQEILTRMDLHLNEGKTRVVDARQEMFSFLGFEIGIWRTRGTGKWYAHVQPSKKSLQTIKGQITRMTARAMTCIPLDHLVGGVNQSVRGWVEYFHFRNCSKRMLQVRAHLEERLRTHLRKRHKVRNRGYIRFPHRDLYEKYGLYKVPATAGWKRVHALR